MTRGNSRLGPIVRVAATFAAIVAVCAWLVRPFDGGPAATDAAASVPLFRPDRRRSASQAFVNTTPKPLLTVVYGGLHALTGDWVAGAWVAVWSSEAASLWPRS